jgi:ribosome-binding protein aMBF1 (putative translation factor)
MAMNKAKRRKLEAAGYKVGSAADFLGLSDEEEEFVRFRLALAHGVVAERKKAGITQVELAKRIGSSQSRIAKLESADPSVSTDLALRALFALGATRKGVAKIVAASIGGKAA